MYCQVKNYLDICAEMWYSVKKGEEMDILEISSDEYEIPKIFLKIDYIPAELLFRGREIPRFIKIDGRKWIANVREAYPFYERNRRERKEK